MIYLMIAMGIMTVTWALAELSDSENGQPLIMATGVLLTMLVVGLVLLLT